MASRQETEAVGEVTRETGTDPAVMAAVASVLLAWYQFYLRGNREAGLFVGLWPPTILAFANYFEQTRMADKLEYAVGRSEESLRQSVSRMIQGQSQQ
jgi:hypothetical protein